MNVLFSTRPPTDRTSRRNHREREERFYREHAGHGPRTVARIATLFGGARSR